MVSTKTFKAEYIHKHRVKGKLVAPQPELKDVDRVASQNKVMQVGQTCRARYEVPMERRLAVAEPEGKGTEIPLR